MRTTILLVLIASLAVLTACAPRSRRTSTLPKPRSRRWSKRRRPRTTKRRAQGARRRREAAHRLGRSGRGQEWRATNLSRAITKREFARQERRGCDHARSRRGQMALPRSRSSKGDGGWHFDSAAGAEELINRRVGENELATIQSCLAFVDAQREYYMRNPQKDPLLHYANKLISTEGKKDGLYWPAAADEEQSPLGEGFAQARAEGYLQEGDPMKGVPFHGYIYRMLTRPGTERCGRRLRLPRQRQVVRRIRADRVPRRVRQLRSHDLHRESRWRGLLAGPRADTTKLALAIDKFDPAAPWKREEAGGRHRDRNCDDSCELEISAAACAAALRAPCASA